MDVTGLTQVLGWAGSTWVNKVGVIKQCLQQIMRGHSTIATHVSKAFPDFEVCISFEVFGRDMVKLVNF
jgi:hypothetical protein